MTLGHFDSIIDIASNEQYAYMEIYCSLILELSRQVLDIRIQGKISLV